MIRIDCEVWRNLAVAFHDPAYQAVYLAIKTFISDHKRAPSTKELDLLIPRGRLILQRMKKSGIIGKGRIDIEALDAKIRYSMRYGQPIDGAPAPALEDDQAKVLTAILKTNLAKMGVEKTPPSWFAIQRGIAKSWLKEGGDFEHIKRLLDWIFTDKWATTYLAPHCDSMTKVKTYDIKYQMAKKPPAPKRYDHEEFIARATASA